MILAQIRKPPHDINAGNPKNNKSEKCEKLCDEQCMCFFPLCKCRTACCEDSLSSTQSCTVLP
eukprot:3657573-Amphidinium_carterae.1